MTLDKIKTGSGRLLRTNSLHETALPVPYDATAMPGAIVLGTDGVLYASIKNPANAAYAWQSLAASGTEKLDITGNIKASGNLVSTGLRTRNQVVSTVPRDPISIQLGEFQRTPTLQVQGETRDTTACMVYSAGEVTPLLATTRTRGTLSTPLATTVGDAVGGWNSYSFDGTEYTVSASLQAVAGDTTTGSSPGEWRFQTTPSGSTSTSIRMAITASGNILINNTTGTERLSVTGNIQLTEATDSYKVGTNNVVGSRKTGWAAPTGTATRTTFATSSVTTEQLAERVKALIDDLTSHGLIGT